MAAGKKSFVLYTDYDTIFEQLTDAEAGQLIKHLFKYVKDKNPVLEDRLLKILFEPIRLQLKRDLKTWEGIKEKRAEIGRKGGKASASKRKQKQPIASTGKQTQAKQPVTGNGTVNVNDNVTVNDAEKEILANQIRLEQICMNTKNTDLDFVKSSLRKFHLHLQENDRYPQKRSQVFAGFEKWLLKEKKQTHGHTAIENSPRHKGAGLLITSLKQDYAARRKEDD